MSEREAALSCEAQSMLACCALRATTCYFILQHFCNNTCFQRLPGPSCPLGALGLTLDEGLARFLEAVYTTPLHAFFCTFA